MANAKVRSELIANFKTAVTESVAIYKRKSVLSTAQVKLHQTMQYDLVANDYDISKLDPVVLT